jgi:site-specific DNA-methyltransferase (adenine-specific)
VAQQVTPYYSQDGITIYHGDCRDVLPSVGAVSTVITSPPYNLGGEPWPHLGNWKQGDSAGGRSKWQNGSDAGAGIQYGTHTDTMDWEDYVAWQHAILAQCWGLLTEAGAIFYNHKPRVIGAKLWTPFELVPPCAIVRQLVIWKRPGGLNFNPTAFVPTHEWVLVLAKPAFRLKSKGVSGLGDVWDIAPERNAHPAPFPTGLPDRVLDAVGGAGVVLDPFAGSGTTLVAAKLRGHRAIGIEIDERYCEMAAKRLSQGSLFGAIGDVQGATPLTAASPDGQQQSIF